LRGEELIRQVTFIVECCDDQRKEELNRSVYLWKEIVYDYSNTSSVVLDGVNGIDASTRSNQFRLFASDIGMNPDEVADEPPA
jgi:hypothetical protein